MTADTSPSFASRFVYIWNPKFEGVSMEGDKIQSFSETPAEKTDVKQLHKAEEQTHEEAHENRKKDAQDMKEQRQQEKEEKPEERSKEEGGDMDFTSTPDLGTPEATSTPDVDPDEAAAEQAEKDFSEMRARLLEYGTPAGVKSSGGCKNCGCEDAADAAITDAQIEDSEGTDKKKSADNNDTTNQGLGGGADTGGFGDTGGISFEWAVYKQLSFEYNYFGADFGEDYLPVQEGFFDAIGSLFGIAINKVMNIGRKVFRFSREKISDAFMRVSTIQQLWASKLNRILPHIKPEKLEQIELAALDRETWIKACKCAVRLYELVKTGEQAVFDLTAGTELTETAREIQEQLDEIGVQLLPNRQAVSMDKLLERRQFGSMLDRGYDRSHVPELMHYFDLLARCIPSKDATGLEQQLGAITGRVVRMREHIQDAVARNELSEGSRAFKEAWLRLTDANFRLNYLFACMRCCYALFDRLTIDIKDVCKKYEMAAD